jgi:hypothetical protein
VLIVGVVVRVLVRNGFLTLPDSIIRIELQATVRWLVRFET